jgi:hypothetical protein
VCQIGLARRAHSGKSGAAVKAVLDGIGTLSYRCGVAGVFGRGLGDLVNDDRRWERYGALGGILFVVLVIASIAVTGGNAKASDSPGKILQYFHDHQDGLRVGAFISVIASVPIIWWAGSLWAYLARRGDRSHRLGLIAVLGLLIGGVGNLTQTGVNAAVALELGRVSGVEAKFFFVMSQTLGAGGLVGLAVLVFAASIAGIRYDAFPRWIAWLGIVDGIVFVIAAATIATTNDAIGAAAFAGFILWSIWLIATSVTMYRATEDVAVLS